MLLLLLLWRPVRVAAGGGDAQLCARKCDPVWPRLGGVQLRNGIATTNFENREEPPLHRGLYNPRCNQVPPNIQFLQGSGDGKSRCNACRESNTKPNAKTMVLTTAIGPPSWARGRSLYKGPWRTATAYVAECVLACVSSAPSFLFLPLCLLVALFLLVFLVLWCFLFILVFLCLCLCLSP